MRITIVAGARPNFMKIAPIIEAINNKMEEGYNLDYRLVHTGQHYNENLSGSFFKELGIPQPEINLNVGSGTQAEQTAAIMKGFEKELEENPCDLVIVVGDVTSTMACAIVTKKGGVDLAHVEAGIRSGDMSMPEEINRIVTDSLSDYFFTTTTIASQNLLNLGVGQNQIFLVGNVMIDTLLKHEPNFKKPSIWDSLGLVSKKYLVMTMHRPSNVDEGYNLRNVVKSISEFAKGLPIIFPVHPRTAKAMVEHSIEADNIHMIDPLGYLEFNYLVKHAMAVITDSGGITEETTVLKIPCITLRENTERPETCDIGTNILVGNDIKLLESAFIRLHKGEWPKGGKIDLWDGKSAERIVDKILEIYRDK